MGTRKSQAKELSPTLEAELLQFIGKSWIAAAEGLAHPLPLPFQHTPA